MTLKQRNVLNSILYLSFLISVIIICIILDVRTSVASSQTSTSPTTEAVTQESVGSTGFDTTVLEALWCGSFNDGTVRMVGAWWHADGVVEDEQGHLWNIEQTVDKQDFLLLWIADNHTPNNTTDDVVIKVWTEAH